MEFSEIGLNVGLYFDVPDDVTDIFRVCPTSAMTGEGIPDLIGMVVKTCQNQLKERLYEKQSFECTVLEVKMIEGHGTTIDVVLKNGEL